MFGLIIVCVYSKYARLYHAVSILTVDASEQNVEVYNSSNWEMSYLNNAYNTQLLILKKIDAMLRF